jgi:hypothetical protein
LAAGTNLAVLGSELFQFGEALPLGGGSFRLSQLLRGRGGTEWACGGHVAGEIFCMLDPGAVRLVTLPNSCIGAKVEASINSGPDVSIVFSGESLRPPSPINLVAATDSVGGLRLSWTRRSRQGFAWVDEIDAPLGETSEQYRIILTGTAGEADYTVGQPSLTVTPADVADLGSGPAQIEVRQIGDFAASRPTQLTITLP